MLGGEVEWGKLQVNGVSAADQVLNALGSDLWFGSVTSCSCHKASIKILGGCGGQGLDRRIKMVIG